jgi:hypothetical protein
MVADLKATPLEFLHISGKDFQQNFTEQGEYFLQPEKGVFFSIILVYFPSPKILG